MREGGCDKMKAMKQILLYLLLSAYALAEAVLYTYLETQVRTYYRGAVMWFATGIVMYLLFGVFLALIARYSKITSWKVGILLAAVNILIYRIAFFRLWFGTLPNLLLLLAGFELIQCLPVRRNNHEL